MMFDNSRNNFSFVTLRSTKRLEYFNLETLIPILEKGSNLCVRALYLSILNSMSDFISDLSTVFSLILVDFEYFSRSNFHNFI